MSSESTASSSGALPLRPQYILIAVVSMAGLMVEILLTRIFEFQLWYHFVSLAVSIPFLGFGAAGSYLSLPHITKAQASRSDKDRAGYLTGLAAAFSLTLIICFWGATALPVDVENIAGASQIALFSLYVLLFTVPFFFLGLIVCDILAGAGKAVGRLYGADLAGAAAGCALVLILLRPIGAPVLIMSLAVLVLVSALPLGLYAGKRAWIKLFGAMIGIILIWAGLGLFTVFDIHPAPTKAMSKMLKGHTPEYTKWDILYRVVVSAEGSGFVEFGGGPTEKYRHLRIVGKPVFQDGILLTWLIKHAGDNENNLWPLHLLQAVPYQIKQNPENVAILGVGGGPDVWIGRVHDAKKMVGVEINPVVSALLEDTYAEYTGRLTEAEDFQLYTAEGRHFISRSEGNFDLIQLTAVDTVTSAFRGSNAMVESYLYTKEAVAELYEKLAPGGVLSYTRWMFRPPRESLRLFHTMQQVLIESGVRRPWDSLMVVAKYTPPISWADVMVKKGAFTHDEISRVESWCDEQAFMMIFMPGDGPDQSIFAGLARSENPQALASTYLMNITPPTDDSPFFFNYYKPGSTTPEGNPVKKPLGLTLSVVNIIVVGAMALLFIIAPLFPVRSALKSINKKGAFIIYFAGLGMGFILFEIALIQRFIILVGGPARALAVVLFSLLLFSGIGSRLSEKVEATDNRRFRLVLIALAFLLGLEAFILYAGFTTILLPAPVAVRYIAAVLLIAPAGLLMGMPFPLALRRLALQSSTAAPWAWGINACLTIVGSAAAPLIAAFSGFSVVMGLSVIFYLGSALASSSVASSE